MKRILPCLLVLVMAACGDSDGDRSSQSQPGRTRFDQSSRDAAAALFRATLEERGYTVTEGCYYLLELQDCGAFKSCFGNNPTSPYGLYAFPEVGAAASSAIMLPRYQTAACLGVTEEEVQEDYYAAWHVREDEAFLFFGRTPPEARYFGQTAYIFDRSPTVYGEDPDPEDERTITFASLGDTLSHLRIVTPGADPFDQDVVIITTADTRALEDVTSAVTDAGVDPSLINRQVIPLAVPEYKLRMGWGEDTDVFSWIWRTAIFTDPDAGERYQMTGQPAIKLFRITPNTPREAQPLPVPGFVPRGTGITEESLFPGLGAALDELEERIRAAHDGVAAVNPSSEILELTGAECLENGTNCLGDNRDAAYYRNLTGRQLDDDDYFIVFGVNHEATGKALYSNLAVYYLEILLGIDSITSAAMADSTYAYLPEGHPFRDLLYVVEVRRDCQGATHCLDVPVFEQDPDGFITTPGLPEDAMVVFAERGYVDPTTGVGPGLTELTMFRALKVTR